MTDNLLERLRSRKLDIDPVGNEGTLPVNPDGEEAANYIEELGAILADAYGAFLDWDELLKSRADQEAVARIEALEAENARLVARLEVYEGAQSGPIKTTGVVDSLAGAAAALEAENARLRNAVEHAVQTALVEDQKNRTDWFNISSRLWVWLIESGAIDDMPLVEGEEDAVLQNLQNAINAYTEAAVRRALEMAAEYIERDLDCVKAESGEKSVQVWEIEKEAKDIRAIRVEDVLARVEKSNG